MCIVQRLPPLLKKLSGISQVGLGEIIIQPHNYTTIFLNCAFFFLTNKMKRVMNKKTKPERPQPQDSFAASE